MKTYKDIFAKRDRAQLIPFFVLGDPNPSASVELIKAAVAAGADALELGIPFSDPIADGPTIQAADIRALEQGVTCAQAFEMIREIRDACDVPIGLLMYYNLICYYGKERFYRDAAAAGVNSVLIADLCIDDAEEVEQLVHANGLESVYMVTPNTTEQRKKLIAQKCTGLIYTVAVLGVTGERAQLSTAIGPLIQSLKQMTDTPVCVGFGVSTPEHCKELAAAGADGMFVGSAVVRIIEEHLNSPDHGKKELVEFISRMRQSLEK
ncbi:MAG: tryptophan synthase subunit alpha, partial [Sedimentisphaerales bacterium]|nr:tryptophan synthase subunit alpha [Sedimentisphaerales bacterium]